MDADGDVDIPQANEEQLQIANLSDLAPGTYVLQHHERPIRVKVVQRPYTPTDTPTGSTRGHSSSLWRQELAERGTATCPHANCRLAFLTMSGAASHTRTCPGVVKDGNFVECEHCGARFKHFRYKQAHVARGHDQHATVKTEGASEMESTSAATSSSVSLEALIDSSMGAAASARILNESRLISTPRPRGRPSTRLPQRSSPEKALLQYSDPFDMAEDPDFECRQNSGYQIVQLQPVSSSGGSEEARVVGRRVSRKRASASQAASNDSDAGTSPKLPLLIGDCDGGARDDLDVRERELREEESRIKELERLVLESERLAREAKRAAIEEKERQLERKKKELQKRYAEAVQILETSKTLDEEADPAVPTQSDEIGSNFVDSVDSTTPTLVGSPEETKESPIETSCPRDPVDKEVVESSDGNEGEVVAQAHDITAHIEPIVKEARPNRSKAIAPPNTGVNSEAVVSSKARKKHDLQEGPPPSESSPNVQESSSRRTSTRKRISKISDEFVTESTPKRTPRERSKKSQDPGEKAVQAEEQSASTKRSEVVEAVEVGSPVADSSPAEGIKVPARTSAKTGSNDVPAASNVCGKCEVSCSTAALLLRHVAGVHGGLARPKGQSQDFAEAEAEEASLAAFQYAKSVQCYRCDKKPFISKLGLKIHLEKCGKSLQEIDSLKESCTLCDYRCMPRDMTAHLRRHREREKLDAVGKLDNLDDDSLVGESPSGRKQRRAAVKAGSKVAEAIGILKANEDGTVAEDDGQALEGEDDADEMYNATKDLNLKDHYSKKKGKAICRFCQATFDSRKEIESHIISEHDQELQEEEDDDDEGVDEDDDFDEEEAGSDEESPWRIGRRRSAFAGRGQGQPFLDPTTTAIRLEHKYRKANYEKSSLQEFHTKIDDWRKLDDAEALSHLPGNSRSGAYKSRSCSSKAAKESRVLDRFTSHADNNYTASFFAGGPVWAAAWCPMADDGDGDAAYVAVSAHADQVDSRLKETQEGKGLLQIWQLNKRSLEMKMVFGIAHSFGKMRSLTWAPSGNQRAEEQRLERLGLVACSCSDGTVRLYSIPRPEALLGDTGQETGVLFDTQPVLSLRLNVDECPTAACLRVAWFRGARHRVVAGGFADGLVALWDIEHPQGGLLRPDADLFPFARVLAHSSSVTGLVLSDHAAVDDPSFPSTLATGSSDRTISIWNLETGDTASGTPSRSIKRGLVSDLAWMHHYPNHVAAAFDDVYLQGHSQTLVFDFIRDQTTPVGAQNSAVWSLSLNPWVNVLMTATSGGELVAFLAQALDKTLDDKFAARRRVYIYRTETVTSEENSDEKTLCFVDVPVHDLKSVPEDEQRLSRAAVSMAQEDLAEGAIGSINRVQQNTDLHSLGWTLTAGQAGVCRVINVAHLQSQAVKKEIKTLHTCL